MSGDKHLQPPVSNVDKEHQGQGLDLGHNVLHSSSFFFVHDQKNIEDVHIYKVCIYAIDIVLTTRQPDTLSSL